MLAEGKDTAAVCRELGVSEATYHRWRNQFGGLKAEDAKRLKDLERENATLKRLLADSLPRQAAALGAVLSVGARFANSRHSCAFK
jgi:transposase-like protein